jgi:hypothetical protein
MKLLTLCNYSDNDDWYSNYIDKQKNTNVDYFLKVFHNK